MRLIQTTAGILIIVLGLLFLLAANGWLVFSIADLAAIALILSGALFLAPGFAWRRTMPWITSLFIPGLLTFALGFILLYTSRAGWSELWYLWIALVVALGLAFLAMYYLGPRARALWLAGVLLTGLSLFSLALFLALFSSIPETRIAGALVLILLGLAFALRGLAPSKPGRGISTDTGSKGAP